MATTGTKDIGILMHQRSVKGLLEGIKTQTRRIIKGPELVVAHPAVIGWEVRDGWAHPLAQSDAVKQRYISTFPNALKCAYGRPGDTLWVREAWAAPEPYDDTPPREIPKAAPIYYPADKAYSSDRYFGPMGKTRPGLFMVRWMARLTRTVKAIRVERVQDIAYADIKAEGVRIPGGMENGKVTIYVDLSDEGPARFLKPGKPLFEHTDLEIARAYFAALWENTNGRGAWARNDWVYVVDFGKVNDAANRQTA